MRCGSNEILYEKLFQHHLIWSLFNSLISTDLRSHRASLTAIFKKQAENVFDSGTQGSCCALVTNVPKPKITGSYCYRSLSRVYNWGFYFYRLDISVLSFLFVSVSNHFQIINSFIVSYVPLSLIHYTDNIYIMSVYNFNLWLRTKPKEISPQGIATLAISFVVINRKRNKFNVVMEATVWLTSIFFTWNWL